MSVASETDRVVGALQDVADRLRADTAAGRTTVRLEDEALGLKVGTVAAESLDAGVHSIRALNQLDQWSSAAVTWLDQNRVTFVMDDCLNPWDEAVAPEPDVVDTYGIRSEMVSPVIAAGNLIGWVSVHYTKGARSWTPDEIARIEAACAEVLAILQAVGRTAAP